VHGKDCFGKVLFDGLKNSCKGRSHGAKAGKSNNRKSLLLRSPLASLRRKRLNKKASISVGEF
jgi:hypothetical protein